MFFQSTQTFITGTYVEYLAQCSNKNQKIPKYIHDSSYRTSIWAIHKQRVKLLCLSKYTVQWKWALLQNLIITFYVEVHSFCPLYIQQECILRVYLIKVYPCTYNKYRSVLLAAKFQCALKWSQCPPVCGHCCEAVTVLFQVSPLKWSVPSIVAKWSVPWSGHWNNQSLGLCLWYHAQCPSHMETLTCKPHTPNRALALKWFHQDFPHECSQKTYQPIGLWSNYTMHKVS